MATVTLTLTKQPTEGCTYIEHSTRLLIRESHLEAIQRKHGLSLIKWLETALEIELEALTEMAIKGNITRVVVIDPFRPEEMRFGTSDLTRHDEIYVKVHYDGSSDKSAAATMTCAAYVFLASSADKVQIVMKRHKREEKELKDRQYKELMQVQAEHGAR